MNLTVTLQSRIIILLTIFTVITVGIFVAVQLAHEFARINEYLINKAQNDAYNIKYELERAIAPLSPKEQKKVLAKSLYTLKKSQIFRKAYILDKSRNIIISTEAWLKETRGDRNDSEIVNKVNQGVLMTIEPVVDRQAKEFSIYIPLLKDNITRYVVRAFFPLGSMWKAAKQVYQSAILIGILLVLTNIVLGIFLAHLIIGPIRIFNEAAKKVASGYLGLRVGVRTNDELEELADTFNFMTLELVKMKDKAESANPLTKLPGNIMIMEEVEKRIKNNQEFVVIYSDLDNFKAFNDKYGIAKGDDAIRLLGEILKTAVKEKGTPDDFIGHEGGDDFILLTTPQRAEEVANFVVEEFDKKVRSLYAPQDLEKGYITAHSREGTIQQFPIMTVSLAGVTNQYRSIKSYGEMTNIAAEIKKKTKQQQRSCFILDLRKD